MCQYQSLYRGEEGYVVFCKGCRCYQLAFQCICITLNETDFLSFLAIIKRKTEEAASSCSPNSKSVFIQTPAQGIGFLFTRSEVERFAAMMDEADNEVKALTMINLINLNRY